MAWESQGRLGWLEAGKTHRRRWLCGRLRKFSPSWSQDVQCCVCRGGRPASLETLNLRCFQDMLEEWDGRCRMDLEL